MSGISFSVCSFIYIIIFLVVYFGKKRINLIENKVYSALLITTTIGLIIDILGYVSFKNGNVDSMRNVTIAKTYLIYYFTWPYLLTIYTCIISFKKKKHNNYTKPLTIIYLILALLIISLPVYIKTSGETLYSYGPSVNLVYLISGLCIMIMIICLILKRKEINPQKYIPLFALIVFGGIVTVIQKKYPDLLLLIATESIITALMYFTIENPDMQMVEELSKNKKLTEDSYNEKTRFIFKISQDIKQPLLDIADESEKIISSSTDNVKEYAIKINDHANQLYTYINKALDISTMDIKNLKVVTSPYTTQKVFEEIKLRTKNEIKTQNKKIEFRYNISNNIPETLLGDDVKIKQSLLSIIFDSIKHTNSGFIELNINSIVKYGVCRLIIEISDSGCGMDLEKINKILGNTGELTKEELEKITKLNISLTLVNKIIKTINGNLIIKSKVGNGTTFNIIIDQKIADAKLNRTAKKIEEYEKKLTINKKILIISANNEFIKKVKENVASTYIDVEETLYVKDCLEKINQAKYQYILVDELKGQGNLEILKTLKTVKNMKTPLVVAINKNEEFMTKHYIEDGFTDYILKDDIENTLKKLNKYL